MSSHSNSSSLQVTENLHLKTLREKCEAARFDIPPRLDDKILCKFLRLRKGNLDEALKFLQKYYQNINRNRDYTAGIRPLILTTALTSGAYKFLRQRANGCRVAVMNFRNWDTARYQFRDGQLAMLYQIEYVSMETETQDSGIIQVVDFSGFTFSHVRQCSYKEMKRVLGLLQDGLPLKLSQVHCVNIHHLVKPLVLLAMSIMKTKLKNRVFLHYSDSMEEFHKVIDPEILPLSLGGNIEDAEAFDLNLIQHILKENVNYEEFWNPELMPSYSSPPRTI